MASNVPRRYASLVNAKGVEGLEQLTDEDKKFIPPLPIVYAPTLTCYSKILEATNSGNLNFPKAQALKDATMAYFILKNWSNDELPLHYNAAYHSNNSESTYWYLKHDKPKLNIVTITTLSQQYIA